MLFFFWAFSVSALACLLLVSILFLSLDFGNIFLNSDMSLTLSIYVAELSFFEALLLLQPLTLFPITLLPLPFPLLVLLAVYFLLSRTSKPPLSSSSTVLRVRSEVIAAGIRSADFRSDKRSNFRSELVSLLSVDPRLFVLLGVLNFVPVEAFSLETWLILKSWFDDGIESIVPFIDCLDNPNLALDPDPLPGVGDIAFERKGAVGDSVLLLFDISADFSPTDFEVSELLRVEVVLVELPIGFWSFLAFEEAVGDMKLEERGTCRVRDPVDFLSVITILGELTFIGRIFGDRSDCVREIELPPEVFTIGRSKWCQICWVTWYSSNWTTNLGLVFFTYWRSNAFYRSWFWAV